MSDQATIIIIILHTIRSDPTITTTRLMHLLLQNITIIIMIIIMIITITIIIIMIIIIMTIHITEQLIDQCVEGYLQCFIEHAVQLTPPLYLQVPRHREELSQEQHTIDRSATTTTTTTTTAVG
jgi:hypothetical protein